nr:alpha/beta fold hydrolase [Ramlibacter albus]
MMHGAEANRQMFGALVPLLADRFTVIAYDQRDCGDTESPAQPATLQELANDAAALVHGLGWERAHVFGSSFGGRVAQAMALLHPGSVDRLVLGSTWAIPLTYEQAYPEGASRIGELRLRLPDTAEELAGWFFPERFLRERPDLRRIFANARPNTERSQRRTRTVSAALNLTPAAIEAPTLVFAGALDRVVPPQITTALADSIPGSRRLMLDDVGHVTVMQATDAVAHAITNFLEETEHEHVSSRA